MSFVLEDGPKGASAKKIEEEEGGELVLEDESNRLYGKIKVSLMVLIQGNSVSRIIRVMMRTKVSASLVAVMAKEMSSATSAIFKAVLSLSKAWVSHSFLNPATKATPQ